MTLQLLCGTDPFPTDFRAKKYKLHKHFITKEDFQQIMRSLPLPVSEADIEEMFSFADKDGDGQLSYEEFLTMIKPQQPPPLIKPSINSIKEL